MENKQTFKGMANKPPESFFRGIRDCIDYYRNWYTNNKFLRRTGHIEYEPINGEWDDWYTNGWAEGNLCAYSMWRDYWKYGNGKGRGVKNFEPYHLNNRLN